MSEFNGKVRRLSLDEFKAEQGPQGFEELLGRINGGSFMECHKLVARETGIWIDELVPVFQKLDAQLASRPLPRTVAS